MIIYGIAAIGAGLAAIGAGIGIGKIVNLKCTERFNLLH
jgi:F0F1-type ATP synthase membrane subunit c/vacuolar-type H+-ATPase subunit K